MTISVYSAKILRLLKEMWRLVFILDGKSFFRFIAAIFITLPEIVKRKNLGPPHERMYGHPCTFTVDGHKVTLDGVWFGYAAETYGRGIYAARPEFKILPGMTVVDLGASGGVVSIPAAKAGAFVIAVEANKASFHDLLKNAERNGVADSVRAEWALVGGATGIYADREALRETAGAVPPLVTVDDLLAKHGLREIDFLKIDIEGSEYDLIRNSPSWLPKVKLIVMEVERAFGDPGELAAILKKAGFTVWLLNNNLRAVPEIAEVSGYIYAKRP